MIVNLASPLCSRDSGAVALVLSGAAPLTVVTGLRSSGIDTPRGGALGAVTHFCSMLYMHSVKIVCSSVRKDGPFFIIINLIVPIVFNNYFNILVICIIILLTVFRLCFVCFY